MPESQNIEYKSTWRDDYLKWICDFANSTLGILVNLGLFQSSDIRGAGAFYILP